MLALHRGFDETQFRPSAFDCCRNLRRVANPETDLDLRTGLSLPKTPSVGVATVSESEHDCRMIAIAFLFVRALCDRFKSRRRLEAEILVRWHAPRRLYLSWADRALLVWLYRRFPHILDAITIVRPETINRWHRMGFAACWRWKSRWAVVDHGSTKRCAT
jgi:hypothetical protein